jgi:hypothetical protein
MSNIPVALRPWRGAPAQPAPQRGEAGTAGR